jgi:hypothetical protein
MTITKDEAIQTAVNFLSSRIEHRLEIVDHIEGNLYDTGKINFKNSWIIHVGPEAPVLDGKEQYIVIDKNTGVMNEIIT